MACLLALNSLIVIGMAIFQICLLVIWAQKNLLSHNMTEQLVSKHTISNNEDNNDANLPFK